MGLEELVNDYKIKIKNNNSLCHPQNNMCCSRNTCSTQMEKACYFDKIITNAVFPGGKIHPHQRRVGRERLDCFKQKIIPLKQELMKCQDFDSILVVISEIQLKGIGDLTKYDVTLRISSSFNIYPDKVYLHAGTRIGALNLGLTKKGYSKKYLNLCDIDKSLSYNLKPHEIEDFLCIYKNDFLDLVLDS